VSKAVELTSTLREATGPEESGPSASADWRSVDPESGRGRRLRALPGEGSWRPRSSSADKLYVIADPGVARAPGSGLPQVGLTLILERAPRIGDKGLDALVTGGVLSASLTITPTADEVQRVASATGASAVPLFVRSASWTLRDAKGDKAFAKADVQGNGGAASFSQTVTREVALAALAALRGAESRIEVRCEAEFRALPGKHPPPHVLNAAGGTTITMSVAQVGGVPRRVTLERSFSDVVQDSASLPMDALVKAVCPSPDGTLQPIPSLLPNSRGARDKPGFAAIGGAVAEIPAVLKTSVTSRINAHALAASGIAGSPAGKLQRWQVADLIVHPPAAPEQNQNLPVIEAEAALWPDRVDQQRYWYAPEFAIVAPAPTMDASNSPFRFAFSVVGFGEGALPILEASVKFTLQARMSDASAAAWESLGRPRCEPVPTNGLSAMLIVPFVNERGEPAETSVTATELTAVEGGLEANFALTDRFARLAYGALGTAGFQKSPARLEVAYCFPAYEPIESRHAPVLWGGKSAAIDRLAVRRPPLGAVAFVGHHLPTVAHPDLLTAVPPVVATHPILTAPAVFIPPKTYGIRTQGRNVKLDAFFACSTFGALYVQKGDPAKGEADKPIGCRNAWTLGQFQLRLYEPLDVDLGIPDAPYKVYRSIQVPGRFLVVPKAYTITRYEPSDWRAYRPALFLYSNIDAVHPERTSCILTGTLRPALTPADRRTLLEALRLKAHSNPGLEWPTELGVDPEINWAIPGDGQISPSAARTPEGFQVSLGASLDHILILKSLVETSGVTAGLEFHLEDGSWILSMLNINLGEIDGPWEAGAVSAKVDGGRATLTNHTERAADIEEILLYSAGAPVGAAEIERRLGPNETTTSDSLPGGTDEVLVNYALANTGGSLEEIRTFVEDLHTNVVFVSTFDWASAGLQEVTVEGRIVGVDGTATAKLKGEAPSAEMPFVLPLTSYLSQPTLQYRTTFLAADGNGRTGEWRDWRLDLQGNVIELKKD
jgi:hypothetical protein